VRIGAKLHSVQSEVLLRTDQDLYVRVPRSSTEHQMVHFPDSLQIILYFRYIMETQDLLGKLNYSRKLDKTDEEFQRSWVPSISRMQRDICY
jgi:hypothetical protein